MRRSRDAVATARCRKRGGRSYSRSSRPRYHERVAGIVRSRVDRTARLETFADRKTVARPVKIPTRDRHEDRVRDALEGCRMSPSICGGLRRHRSCRSHTAQSVGSSPSAEPLRKCLLPPERCLERISVPFLVPSAHDERRSKIVFSFELRRLRYRTCGRKSPERNGWS